MKKILILTALFSATFISSCGDAAEDREQMHSRAKVFQDSIANVIRQSMAEAEAPGPMIMQAAPGTTAAAPAAAPTATPAVGSK